MAELSKKYPALEKDRLTIALTGIATETSEALDIGIRYYWKPNSEMDKKSGIIHLT